MRSTVFTASPSAQQCPLLSRRPSRSSCRIVAAAGVGFGKGSAKKAEKASIADTGSGMYTAPNRKKRVDIVKELGLKNAVEDKADPNTDLTLGNWFDLADVTVDFQEKKRKLVELKGNKKMVVLHLFNDTIFAMDAFSTAYQYPLLDAKLEEGPDGPVIETPLDGTVYDLKTGKVIKWCPSDGSAIRGLLRTLKADVSPVPLTVYPVVVKPDGKVWVRLSNTAGRRVGDGHGRLAAVGASGSPEAAATAPDIPDDASVSHARASPAPASPPPPAPADNNISSATTSCSGNGSSGGSSGGSGGSGGSGSGRSGGIAGWLRQLVTDQYLPLMLLSALVAAALQPAWGLAAAQTSLQSAVTFTIFVLQGVMLRRSEAGQALGAVGAISWGLASILLITPLLAPLAGALPLQPPGLALGLLVFCCMPTTLSSGVALTQVLGGSTALALLLTIASNLASVFTLPFLLPWALQASAALGGFSTAGGAAGAARLDPLPLLLQLVQCILLPTLAGAGLRGALPALRVWVDANRRTLSVISGGLLSLVPWMQVSKALAQGVVVSPAALAAAVAWSLLIHTAYLGLNTAAATVLQLGGPGLRSSAPTRRALIIVASQKTLPVAMAVLGRLAPAVGAEAAGCAAVTVVFSHLAQTCADFWLVSRWNEHIQRREKAEGGQGAVEGAAAG
ncbi:putative sodium/metabolite cotransporter BASS4, chloroplastic [Tetrabaena socialis]|uniref:Putative sodium/metabolite cotransporter BASS4, chloroplastic n=1 Tax=Tetrabaena socialis TaxID=47790 RepID=A0A2J8AFC6_9CHLO|nr:putative sodium/metabolite cotransporter BASS4, chloroplastic [Tetrabaena socialis]|eukprot:PNH11225.1 putative sodium/metabolite cotransporter BASS4, chloroplastic [Tetrabaena socialis]